MSSLVFEDGGSLCHLIHGELTFATAYVAYSEGVRRLTNLDQGARCEFDCRGITNADSAGLSVLIEWKGEAARRGVSLVYFGLPSVIGRLARISEVDTLLNVD
ncbi:MAG: STAS domain-containing protein [Gammaproteobacteria bacterium]|nr:STAS domain-containing protein [Gammaproteobacteria bacterium]